MADHRQQQAAARMALKGPDEVSMADDKQPNAGGIEMRRADGTIYYDAAIRSEYPRMMYRKTDVEEKVQQTDSAAKCGETFLITNNYGTAKSPLLCETAIANDLDEAETMTADGWDTSAAAAHGQAEGLAKAASAKDDEIAALKAQLAEMAPKERKPRAVRASAEPEMEPASDDM